MLGPCWATIQRDEPAPADVMYRPGVPGYLVWPLPCNLESQPPFFSPFELSHQPPASCSGPEQANSNSIPGPLPAPAPAPTLAPAAPVALTHHIDSETTYLGTDHQTTRHTASRCPRRLHLPTHSLQPHQPISSPPPSPSPVSIPPCRQPILVFLPPSSSSYYPVTIITRTVTSRTRAKGKNIKHPTLRKQLLATHLVGT